jgi:hypothetical protein
VAAAGPPHEWRAALADRLPDYMIPSVFAEFDRLATRSSFLGFRVPVLPRREE